MIADQDEARRLRIRDAALADGLSQRDRAPAFAMPSLLAQTKQLSTYPSVAQSFFGCVPITLLGPEVEGGPGSILLGTSTFLALNLGSVAPPQGTNVLVTFVDSRWVFRFDG